MIKLRWMGTPDELVWFRRHLEEDQNLRLENVSRILPIRTSNRCFMMIGGVCIAVWREPGVTRGSLYYRLNDRLNHM